MSFENSPIAASETGHPSARLLGRYVSNEAGPRRRKVVAAHLEQCGHCREIVRKTRERARMLRDMERFSLNQYSAAQNLDRLPPSL